jgi:hypothetical protein
MTRSAEKPRQARSLSSSRVMGPGGGGTWRGGMEGGYGGGGVEGGYGGGKSKKGKRYKG